MPRKRSRSLVGVIAALAVCCTIHLIILLGAAGAAAGVLGNVVRNPYLIVGGLLLLTIGIGALVINRSKEDGSACCPPLPDEDRR